GELSGAGACPPGVLPLACPELGGRGSGAGSCPDSAAGSEVGRAACVCARQISSAPEEKVMDTDSLPVSETYSPRSNPTTNSRPVQSTSWPAASAADRPLPMLHWLPSEAETSWLRLESACSSPPKPTACSITSDCSMRESSSS